MTTNSPTDTNQASEEVRTKLALILGYERQEQHSSEKTRWYDLDEYGNPIEVTKKVDKVIDLLRTEKLKLLDRLSSHQEDLFWWTGGEYDELEGIDMRAIAAERELLTKLEAEL